MQNKHKTLGLILAGGAGRRIGGLDKGLVEYKGKPLVSHTLDQLRPSLTETVIAVHRNDQQYREINSWVVQDKTEEHQGPMAGIVALIDDLRELGRETEFEFLAIASCDVPNLPNTYIQRLNTAIENSRFDIAVAHDGTRKQNLHCLMRMGELQSIHDFYQSGGRAMHRWFDTRKVIEVDFSDEAPAFLNLNSLDQINTSKT